MNIGAKPKTIEKLKRVHELVQQRKEPSIMAVCKRAKLSYAYYWQFKKKYPELAKEVGYADQQSSNVL